VRPCVLGWQAGIAGIDPRLCPYEKLSAEAAEWLKFHTWACELVAFLKEQNT
jgi:ribosome modulation factor